MQHLKVMETGRHQERRQHQSPKRWIVPRDHGSNAQQHQRNEGERLLLKPEQQEDNGKAQKPGTSRNDWMYPIPSPPSPAESCTKLLIRACHVENEIGIAIAVRTRKTSRLFQPFLKKPVSLILTVPFHRR